MPAYYAYKGPAPTLTGGLVGTTQTFDTSNIDSTALDVAQTSPQAVITVTDNDGKTDTRTIALSDSTDDDTTQITYNGKSYTVQHKWSGTIGSDSYSFYEAKNTEDTVYLCTKSGEATYSAFTLQYAATLVNGINANNLAPVYQATETTGTTTGTETVKSDKTYNLSALVSDNDSKQPTDMTRTVTFTISGAGIEGQSFTVPVSESKAALSSFAPKGEGAATITAMYSGDDVYAPSHRVCECLFRAEQDRPLGAVADRTRERHLRRERKSRRNADQSKWHFAECHSDL